MESILKWVIFYNIDLSGQNFGMDMYSLGQNVQQYPNDPNNMYYQNFQNN
jgi:hypothetical protein